MIPPVRATDPMKLVPKNQYAAASTRTSSETAYAKTASNGLSRCSGNFQAERLRDTISRQISLGAGRINPTVTKRGIIETSRRFGVQPRGAFNRCRALRMIPRTVEKLPHRARVAASRRAVGSATNPAPSRNTIQCLAPVERWRCPAKYRVLEKRAV